MATKAKATVFLEINCNSSWSDETTVSQVKKQAIDNVILEIQQLLPHAKSRIKLIGDPEITIVTFDV